MSVRLGTKNIVMSYREHLRKDMPTVNGDQAYSSALNGEQTYSSALNRDQTYSSAMNWDQTYSSAIDMPETELERRHLIQPH